MNDLINNRILVIDDNPEIHTDFKKILCPAPTSAPADVMKFTAALLGESAPPPTPVATMPAFTIESAMQGEQGLIKVRDALAKGQPFATAFVDMRMPPGWDGLRTIREIWKVDPAINIVVCTAFSDHSWAEIETLAGGGDRLLVLKKPFEGIEVKRLASTLTAKWSQARRAAMQMSELQELVRQHTSQLEIARRNDKLRLDELENVVQQRTSELRKAATHDELTGLPNRTLFHDRLSQALEQGRRQPDFRIAVLFIDFDRFKVVNDSLGHDAGDLLLRSIARRLTNTLRTTDSILPPPEDQVTAARLGGDEFCVMLTGLRRDEDAAAVASRILEDLQRPHDLAGRDVSSSASIGIAVSSSGYERAEDMIRDADNAMYRAKAAGRGRYVMFDRAMHEQALRRLTVENDLRKAIERGELQAHYQPVVMVESQRIAGFEVLARWKHPERGMIAPLEFIEIAEDIGFIGELGAWVLMESCRQLVKWQKQFDAPELTMSVNVSTRQLSNSSFADFIQRAIEETGLNPHSLILEITESALVQQPEVTSNVIAGIKKLGVRLYLDDFGTGYSSLSCLHAFPLDGLKIDRSFIRAASAQRRYAAIVHSIASLAHNLDIEVVAEGVESLEEVALLQSLDCGKAQGYLFSSPVEAPLIEDMLRHERQHRAAA